MKRKTWTRAATVAMALLLIALPLLGACVKEVVKEEPQEPARSAPVPKLEPAPPAPVLEPAPLAPVLEPVPPEPKLEPAPLAPKSEPAVGEIESDLKVEGYLVLGESFSSDSSVTYSAFQVGEQFVVWTGPEESMHTEPTAGETERKGDVPVENIRIISGLYIKDDSFSPIVIRWGQATTAMQPEAATKWLSAGIASYSGMSSVSNFKVEEEGELQAEGKKVLFAEVSYYEQLDGSQFSGLFAAWYDDNSSNVLLLSVMGTPETVDLFRGTVLKEIVIITDDLPDKGGGDPLKGLNISRAKNRCGCSYMSSC